VTSMSNKSMSLMTSFKSFMILCLSIPYLLISRRVFPTIIKIVSDERLFFIEWLRYPLRDYFKIFCPHNYRFNWNAVLHCKQSKSKLVALIDTINTKRIFNINHVLPETLHVFDDEIWCIDDRADLAPWYLA